VSQAEKLKIVEEILGNNYRSGNEHLFFCPKCKHHKKKLSVNFTKDKFKCWVCDFSGPSARLVKRYGTYSQLKQWNELCGIIEIESFDEIFNQANKEDKTPEEIINLPEHFISLCNKDNGLSSLEARRYLNERGISKKDILKWKIGYCSIGPYEKRIIIPSFDLKGKVNYFIARTYAKSKYKKYMNPNASKDIIFNELYLDWSKDIVIVEGVFDAIKADNAIPLLGSTLREDSRLFQQIVKNDSPIYLALDPDAEKKAEKLIGHLLSYDIEIYKIPIPNGIDVGDMTKEQFLELKQMSKLIKGTDDVLLKKIMEI
jgi:DNA primase